MLSGDRHFVLAAGGSVFKVGHMPSTAARKAGDDAKLIRRHRAGDPRARTILIERYLPLARSLARRYANKGEPLDDLEQVASVGLIKAIDRFDLARDVRFATYAVPTIAGELKRHFRDKGRSIHLPRGLQELVLRVQSAEEELSSRTGRSPTWFAW